MLFEDQENETEQFEHDAPLQKPQKQSRIDQKQALLDRKAKVPHSELISECKRIWELLRLKKEKTPKSELIAQLFKLIQGKVVDVIFKHDASRIIQCALKYGVPSQRLEIAAELKGNYVQLSKSQYAKFIVSRIMHLCPSYRQIIAKEFRGNVLKLVGHTEGGVVIDELYEIYANGAMKDALLMEFYGLEYGIFQETTPAVSLTTLLSENPSKKGPVTLFLHKALLKLLEKPKFKLQTTHIVHRALLNLVSLDAAVCNDIIELVLPLCASIVHTSPGCQLVVMIIATASPKTRKTIIKSLKGLVHKIAKEQYAHLLLPALFECVDDTVLIAKSIIAELFDGEKGAECLRDRTASRVILFLMSGRDTRYLNGYIIDGLKSTDEPRQKTTKKDGALKKTQLLEATAPLLLPLLLKELPKIVRDKNGCEILIAFLNNPNLQSQSIELSSSILECLQSNMKSAVDTPKKITESFNVIKKMRAEAIQKKQMEEGLDLADNLLTNRNSTFLIKTMLRVPLTGEPKQWHSAFIQGIWESLSPVFCEWLEYCRVNPRSSGTAFILVAVFENGTDSIQKEMVKISKSFRETYVCSPIEALVVDKDKTGKKRKIEDVNEKSTKVSAISILIDHLNKK